MKDLIDKLIGAVPFFARRLVALLPAPKKAVLALDLESDSALEEAFTFLGVSYGIAFLAQLPLLLDEKDKELAFGTGAAQSAFGFALIVLLMVLVWKMVGAKPAWRKIIAATCYFSGVSTLLLLFFVLPGMGAFRALDPVAYKQIATGSATDVMALRSSAGYWISLTFLALGFAATYFWIFWVWGAYRELMQTSKRRSAIALILFFLFSPLAYLLQGAMSMPTIVQGIGPAVPEDLTGQWEFVEQSDSGGVKSAHSVLYTFSPPPWKIMRTGKYSLREIRGSSNGKCRISTETKEIGQISVRDSNIDVMPAGHLETTRDQCAGKGSNVLSRPSKREYQYKINEDPSGWTLCLNDRFGQRCFTPKK
jgi:hypothetical protein